MGSEELAAEVSKNAIDAYRSSPLLTGLLALNLVFLVGFGYLLMVKNQQHEALISRILDDEKAFRDEMIQLATTCASRHLSSGKPGYYPQIGEQ